MFLKGKTMDSYKKDFENAIQMIDWQNKMLREQALRIAELEKQLKEKADILNT